MAEKQPPLLTTVGMSCQSFYAGRAERLMWRAIRYLTICEQFLALSSCLTVYGYDILTRLEQRKARITSTFRSILKMDPTKKASRVSLKAALCVFIYTG